MNYESSLISQTVTFRIINNEKINESSLPLLSQENKTGTVHFVTFNNVDAAIDVIKERCDVTRKEGDPPIRVTGAGCNLHKKKTQQGLGQVFDSY